ncbi:hypothetical protein [Companilactobacillus muriivasis]|uniref:hypothetical protein n=1 Tax=Companilactobacillus muriivasis TaxID=3081444 RepID=UPI0030C6AF62
MDNNEIEDIATKIKQADAVLVTAANGFSISEVFNLFANLIWLVWSLKEFLRLKVI